MLGGKIVQKSLPIICHEKEGIAFIEINRPDKKNAFN
jgi:enoyl-CoA hydratase/carnithine racemase